jgi:adenosylcobinamide kinase / adenosylcobinamide-phosphate guanylyltransferase
MPLVLLLGGARSGKSRLAVALAEQTGAPVTVLATAEGRDDEMRERIAAHRAERPPDWTTLEEPLELEQALAAPPPEDTLIVDCLSLWVANVLERGDSTETILERGARAAALAAARAGTSIAVSNEVGMGVVPASQLGRAYRDLLGSTNRVWAEAADRAALVVAGRVLPLNGAEALA